MILVKKWSCFLFFFLGNIVQVDVLYEKTPFQALKTRSSSSSNGEIFPKGLTYGFVFFFVRQYRPGNCVLRYSRTRKRLFYAKKKKAKKSENLDFSKGFPMVLFQIWPLIYLFFWAIQARKMRFTMLQNKKGLFTL